MVTIESDIWRLHYLLRPRRWAVVIPTNAGWKADGSNVMGRGLARDAANLYPHLRFAYGEWCQRMGEVPFYYARRRLWCVPSKPLNPDAPWASWKSRASARVIRKGLQYLKEHYHQFDCRDFSCAVPLLGAGNGGISERRSQKIVEEVLGDDERFALVILQRVLHNATSTR